MAKKAAFVYDDAMSPASAIPMNCWTPTELSPLRVPIL